MIAFIAFCAGITVCIIATISGEQEYGRLMYRRGYSQALEDMKERRGESWVIKCVEDQENK